MSNARARIPKASDVVVAAIRTRIVSQRLPVGTRLPSEVEMMDEYGLGRVTVREALRILERDGLIDVRRGPSGGIFVRHTDISQVSDALALLFSFRDTTLGEFAQFRLQLEPFVAKLAAANATQEQRAGLEEAVAAERDASRTADVHSLIAAACGNDVFELVLKSMHSSLVGHFRYELITPEHVEATGRAHAKIVKAIVSGEGSTAERAMRRHLETYAQYLAENGLDAQPILPRGDG